MLDHPISVINKFVRAASILMQLIGCFDKSSTAILKALGAIVILHLLARKAESLATQTYSLTIDGTKDQIVTRTDIQATTLCEGKDWGSATGAFSCAHLRDDCAIESIQTVNCGDPDKPQSIREMYYTHRCYGDDKTTTKYIVFTYCSGGLSITFTSLQKEAMVEVRGFVKDGLVLGFALKSDTGRIRHWGHHAEPELLPCTDTWQTYCLNYPSNNPTDYCISTYQGKTARHWCCKSCREYYFKT